MNEAFELLDIQSSPWPRWRRGYIEDDATEHRHMWLFEPFAVLGNTRAGMPVSACHFRPGADFVQYDDGNLAGHEQAPLCPECLEVDLQYGLRTETAQGC